VLSIISHPLLVLLIAGIFRTYLIRKISRQWRKPKELELKIDLINRINESVTGTISATYLDQVSELENDKGYKKALRIWEIEKEVILSHLNALFPDSLLISDWTRFSLFVTSFCYMNQIKTNEESNNKERREHWTYILVYKRKIWEYFGPKFETCFI
jgi:hypothetical protein